MRTTLSSLAVLLFLLSPPSQAATNLDDKTLQELSGLEQRYFGRSYAAESDETRTQRLEKLVFGDVVEGDAEGRVKRIISATGGNSAAPAPAIAPQVKKGDPQPSYAELTPPEPSPVTANAGLTGEDPYPHVSELESAILGQSYAGQQLTGRISRMEVKAFGKSSNDPDLSARTDALTQYAEQKLQKHLTATSEDSTTVDSSGTDYPRIDALESAILAQKYVNQPLPERLSRMEVKAFGSQSSSADLSQRTDALERYAEKTLHKKPLEEIGAGNSSEAAEGQGGSGKQSQILSKIGKTILGMAGGTMGGLGAPGMIGSGYGPGFGPFGGMGTGGGMGMGRRQASPSPEEQQAENRPEDPAITDSSPPPSNARLLTKVGWCEMQVFEHTSPELHLEKRLEQLNQQLNFAPGKSNMELMDHIGDLMKSVIAQRQSTKPVASKVANPLH